MRDPKRIDKILNLIKEIWTKYPDWRLGQLLCNTTFIEDNIFYMEDDEVQRQLHCYYCFLKQREQNDGDS